MREDLRRVQASQRHPLERIDEVLDYARLETGAVHYEVAPVRVCDALTLAECPPGLAAQADAEKLRQVPVNLPSNAVKLTDRGGRIALACADGGAHVAVTVTDTGIGIPADRHERILDPFVQVRAELTRTAEGTGLGPAISRDLARVMGAT